MTKTEWNKRLRNLPSTFDPYEQIKRYDEFITEPVEISSWNDFLKWSKPFNSAGCFRGQREFEWHLTPTFDRDIFRQYEHDHGASALPVCPEANAKYLLEEFRKAAYLYHDYLPDESHTDEWLALMQHYGCPTRLLDWSSSPYVALYFAIYEASANDSALWALNLQWVLERSVQIGIEWDGLSEASKREHRYPKLVKPLLGHLNQRMVTQQGVLLAASDYDIPFALTLYSMILHDPNRFSRGPIMSKVKISRACRLEFLDELRRMNIHHASLFPGAEGFAKSLSLALELRIESQVEQLIKDDNQLRRRYAPATVPK